MYFSLHKNSVNIIKYLQKYGVILIAFSGVLAGCNSNDGNNDNDRLISYCEFRQQVAEQAGPGSLDCGNSEVGESQTELNTCVAEAFETGLVAFSTYELQGIDSGVARAIAVSADGRVVFLAYDSNICGGPSSKPGCPASRVDTDECDNPMLTGNVDGSYEEVFDCSANQSAT